MMYTSLFSGRLADELRTEQDHGLSASKSAKSLHAQSIELQGRLDEVEEQALRHGKKILAKLEDRVRALEGELGKEEESTVTYKTLRVKGRPWR